MPSEGPFAGAFLACGRVQEVEQSARDAKASGVPDPCLPAGRTGTCDTACSATVMGEGLVTGLTHCCDQFQLPWIRTSKGAGAKFGWGGGTSSVLFRASWKPVRGQFELNSGLVRIQFGSIRGEFVVYSIQFGHN